MKKLYLALLALTLSYGLFAYDFHLDGIYYNIRDNYRVEVTDNGSSDYSGALVIPSTVEYNGITYTVEYIREHAFNYCSELTSVFIPNTVKEIGVGAFANCTDSSVS